MELSYFLSSNPVALWVIAGIVGLLVGSFLNVVIHRLPIMMERRWAIECSILSNQPLPGDSEKTFNLLVPRSRCPSCNTAISPFHNIPVLGWLILRGKCFKCSAPISAQYPLVEAITGALCVVVVAKFGFSLQSVFGVLLLLALITLSAIDFQTTLLPDDITLPLLWLGLIANLGGLFTDINSAVLGAVFGYLLLWSVYHAFRLLTGKEGMGYGDFKLLAALGAWLGWQELPMIILLSSFIGAIVGISLIIALGRDRNIPIPFGPYLAGAGFVALIWGDQLTAYYLTALS